MTDAYVPQQGRNWPWRDLLPTNLDELAELRRRALTAELDGLNAPRVTERFIGWAWAEMENGGAGGRGPDTEAKFRRVLAELVGDDPLSGPPQGEKRQRRFAAAAAASSRARKDRGAGRMVAMACSSVAAGVAAGVVTRDPVLALSSATPGILGTESWDESAPDTSRRPRGHASPPAAPTAGLARLAA